jgi:uncharacterized membrane protein YwzB
MLHYSGVMKPSPTFKRSLQAMVFNTVIALGISAFDDHGLTSNWVYSQCIGLNIWALIELGHGTLVRDDETQLHRMFRIVPVSVVLGYLVGTAVSSVLLGNHGFDFLVQQPRKALGFLFVSMAAGGVISYFFLSRELLALANLRALIAMDPARASDMLDRLVAYLRSTLSASRVTSHPLHVEFDRLRDDLELMAVRMGPRLHYSLDLPANQAAGLA